MVNRHVFTLQNAACLCPTMSPGMAGANGCAEFAIPTVGVRDFVDIDSRWRLHNLPETSPSQLLRGKSLAVQSMRLLRLLHRPSKTRHCSASRSSEHANYE